MYYNSWKPASMLTIKYSFLWSNSFLNLKPHVICDSLESSRSICHTTFELFVLKAEFVSYVFFNFCWTAAYYSWFQQNIVHTSDCFKFMVAQYLEVRFYNLRFVDNNQSADSFEIDCKKRVFLGTLILLLHHISWRFIKFLFALKVVKFFLVTILIRSIWVIIIYVY